MNSKPELISGNLHKDERGVVRFVNDFDMQNIRRFYHVVNNSCAVVRAWQGHKIEEKYFYVSQGSFLIAAAKIDDWLNPSEKLEPETFILQANNPQILFIPAGYANGVQALEEDSSLIVYSNLTLEESANDTFRFDAKLWNVWK